MRLLDKKPLAALALLVAGGGGAAEPPSLTLAEALRELERASPAAAQAQSRADEARALTRQAASALLPTLTAAGSYTRNSDAAEFTRPPVPPLGGQPATPASTTVIQPREAFSASASVRVPLFTPTSWAELSAARHAAAAAAAGSDAVRLQLRLLLLQGAWQAAAGEEMLAAAERAVETARDQARSARRGVDAGLQPPLAALASESQSLRRESDLLRTRAALEKAQLALGVLLGRAERVRVRPPPLAAPAPADAAALAAEALQRRPEPRGQIEQVAAAERGVTAAWLRLVPQLSASGSAFAQDVPLPTGQKEGWRATVDLTWSLYDGGFRYGKRRQAEAQAAGARAAELAQRLAVEEEVADALREVEVSAERLRLSEQLVTVASEAAATASRGFAAGTTGNADVLDANDQLFQAELARADARARLGAAQAALDRATGRL